MGLWDTITGRTKPKEAKLDALFHVPSAAITLQTAMGLVATGDGAVCYRGAAGAGFATTQADLVALVSTGADAARVTTTTDEFGFTWLELDHDPLDPDNPDLTALCTGLHGVNTTLEEQGFGPGLLCSLVPFIGADGRHVGLVYLYKQGTFYPFAPSAPQARDNLLELQVRDALAGELPMEQDLSRWLAIWGAPGL